MFRSLASFRSSTAHPATATGGNGAAAATAHTLYQYQHRTSNGATGIINADLQGQHKDQQQRARTTGVLNGFASIAGSERELQMQDRRKKRRLSSTGLFRIDSTCQCHDRDYPPWTGEIHGMSQALLSKSLPLRVFWWMVLILCTSCGTATTILVIIEYIRGPTATSTTIRLVPSLELPAITICPKVPDAFNFEAVLNDMRGVLPDLSKDMGRDLMSFWIGGSGLENMDGLPDFNQTYLETLGHLYDQWRQGIDTKTFFYSINAKFGYKCEDLFNNCELGGKPHNCCETIFQPRPVMRRGLCYQTLRNINQTEADDIGRLVLEIKSPPSVTSPQYNYFQPQIIIYVNENFEQVLDFPRFYLYPHEWNRMHFVARYIQLLEHPSDCTNRLVGKDANCFVKNWLTANVIDPFNCTVPYLEQIEGVPTNLHTCEPKDLAADYYNSIQLVHSGSVHSQECIPGCTRWEYSVSLQQSPALQPFEHHEFNLEISFYDLQYEHVKEVYTISVPGFMSQIGGQFGFFLGLSIITMIQITIYGLSAVITTFLKIPRKIVQRMLILIKIRRSPNDTPPPAAVTSPMRLAAAIGTSFSRGIVNPIMAETSFINVDSLDTIPEAESRKTSMIAAATTTTTTTTVQQIFTDESPPPPVIPPRMPTTVETTITPKAPSTAIIGVEKRNLLAQTRRKWTSFSVGSTSLGEQGISNNNSRNAGLRPRLIKQQASASARNEESADGTFAQY